MYLPGRGPLVERCNELLVEGRPGSKDSQNRQLAHNTAYLRFEKKVDQRESETAERTNHRPHHLALAHASEPNYPILSHDVCKMS